MKFLLLGLVLFSVALSSKTTFFGGSDDGSSDGADALIASGASHVRVYLLWRYMQASVEAPLENITVASLRNDSSAILSWAAQRDWSELDRRLGLYDKASHIKIIGEVTEGTFFGLPKYGDSLFDPDVVGKDTYLAYVYRAARATVNRYKGRVKMWQIENELNEAWLASLGGQRRHGPAWRDWDFLTQLLSTCRMAVKDEDGGAVVTTNLHTDVAKWVHDALLLPGYYEDAIRHWHPLLDIVSLDAYPNLLVSHPCQGGVVGARVAAALQLSGGKPVFVMEWSYPVEAPSSQLPPDVANYSDARQVACINDTIAAVMAAGGSGLMFFKFAPSPGIVPPPGGYSALDIEALTLLRLVCQHNDDVLYLLRWFESGIHYNYLRTRLPILLGSMFQGYGILMPNGTARPGYYELQKLFSQEWA